MCIEGYLLCRIDSHYLSTALCSRVQSGGLAWESRREPSVSKFSSLWWNTAAAAIINVLSTSQGSLPSLCPVPRWCRIAFPLPVPRWLNCPHPPAGLLWRAGRSSLKWNTSPSLCYSSNRLSCRFLRLSCFYVKNRINCSSWANNICVCVWNVCEWIVRV